MQIDWRTRGRSHVFGPDVLHDNGIIDFKYVIERQTDPAVIGPHLFEAVDPAFASRVRPGDFIVAGPGFGGGKAHVTGYIAMGALGLRVLCESSYERVLRGAANLGVPVMDGCTDITRHVEPGEELEVDMLTGEVVRTRSGEVLRFRPLRADLRQMLETGGREGLLRDWLARNPEMATPREA